MTDLRPNQNDIWFQIPLPRPQAQLRLFCLPYAGGAASVFHRWAQQLPNEIELCAIELPGRGLRLRETPFVRLAPLVRSLADAIVPWLDRPYAVFGYSMGGLIAFELVRLLRRRGGQLPRHLFLSAKAAPDLPPLQPLIHQALDTEIRRKLSILNGTPKQLLENEEMMEMMVPIVRSDFAVLETYQYRQEPPLELPISVFGGAADPLVRPAALEGWRSQSSVRCQLRIFPGDHFFIQDTLPEVMAAMVEDLQLR